MKNKYVICVYPKTVIFAENIVTKIVYEQNTWN